MFKCTNSDPGTFGHECGKPAIWAATRLAPAHIGLGLPERLFTSYYCESCREEGFEGVKPALNWKRI